MQPALPLPTVIAGTQQSLWGAQVAAGGGAPDDVAKLVTTTTVTDLSAIEQALAQNGDDPLLPRS
jgi:hypothetical protein